MIFKGGELYVNDELVGVITEFSASSEFPDCMRYGLECKNHNITFKVKVKLSFTDKIRKFFGLETLFFKRLKQLTRQTK